MTYAEFLARPAHVNDAECLLLLYPKADIHYGSWDTDREYGQFIPSGKPWKTHSIDAKPVPEFTTDRNATAMLVERVLNAGVSTVTLFNKHLSDHTDHWPLGPLYVLRLAPALVAWACCESCKGVQ